MPKTGVPTDARRAATHTGTEQWQSFEIRMRHRRAERCVLRAEAALDAGLESEARAALDEARSLRSDIPSFDELLAAARVRREASEAGRRRNTTRRAGLLAAAGLIVLAGIGWTTVALREAADVETVASAPAPPPPAAPAETTTGAPTPQPLEPEPSPVRIESSTGVPATGSTAERAQAPAPARTDPPPVARERIPEPRAEDPAPPAAPEPAIPAAPEPPATTTSSITRPPVDTSVAATALGAPAAVNLPAPPPARIPDPAPVRTPPEPASQEPAVRDVLARFEAAYSSLSASAARQVWPSVDARSLTRAFEGLESQQVSLGDCRVTVASSTARAECSGSATWTPKVGGGRRTEARRWEFDLTRANGAWLIVQARAR